MDVNNHIDILEHTTDVMVNISMNTSNITNVMAGGPSQALVTANQVTITITLVVLMIGMGATITVGEIWKNLRRPIGITIGLGCQFILMPFLGWSLAHIFQLSPGMALGTLAIATCPGGAMSNILTFFTESDTCLSICMTTVSTVVGIGMMPLNLFIYSRSWATSETVIPYVDIVVALVIILIPGTIGMFINWKWPKKAEVIAQVCGISSIVGIIIVICLISAMNPLLFSLSWKPYIVAFFYPILAFVLGYLIPWMCRQKPPQRRTIAFETGVQNGALALTIINLMFSRGQGANALEMMIVPSLHSIFVVVEGLALVGVYRLWIRYRDNLTKKSDVEMKSLDEKKEKPTDDWGRPQDTKYGLDNPALTYENGIPRQFTNGYDVDVQRENQWRRKWEDDQRMNESPVQSYNPDQYNVWRWTVSALDNSPPGAPLSTQAPMQPHHDPTARKSRNLNPSSNTQNSYNHYKYHPSAVRDVPPDTNDNRQPRNQGYQPRNYRQRFYSAPNLREVNGRKYQPESDQWSNKYGYESRDREVHPHNQTYRSREHNREGGGYRRYPDQPERNSNGPRDWDENYSNPNRNITYPPRVLTKVPDDTRVQRYPGQFDNYYEDMEEAVLNHEQYLKQQRRSRRIQNVDPQQLNPQNLDDLNYVNGYLGQSEPVYSPVESSAPGTHSTKHSIRSNRPNDATAYNSQAVNQRPMSPRHADEPLRQEGETTLYPRQPRHSLSNNSAYDDGKSAFRTLPPLPSSLFHAHENDNYERHNRYDETTGPKQYTFNIPNNLNNESSI
ncbi:uncharacterized protein LOC144359418 [Saccoglossus kowalevskii]